MKRNGEGQREMAFPVQFAGGMVSFESVLRLVILILSACAMAAGVAMMAGWIPVMAHLPGEYRVIFGALVFLYGGYRFSIAFFRHRPMQDYER